MTTTRLHIAPRLGVSKIELLGCLIAIAGGVWIGSIYLGVDLQGAAYTALDETELLTQVPEEWRPPNPDCPDGDCPDPETLRAEENARLRTELDSLRVEVARLEEGAPADGEPVVTTSLTESDLVVRDLTMEYWLSLADIVVEVTSIQQRVTPFSGSGDHARALAVRRRALNYGKQSVLTLDVKSIDPRAVETGVRIAEWFDQGLETLRRASEARGPEPVAGKTVSAERFWSQGETEHAKRTEFVRRKVADASGYLSTRYLTDFPPLGI